jgi:hypothetical protein
MAAKVVRVGAGGVVKETPEISVVPNSPSLDTYVGPLF